MAPAIPGPAPVVHEGTPSEDTWAYISTSKASETLRAYRNDLADFGTYCLTRDVSPLPASPALVADYMSHMASERHLSTATIQRRCWAISQAHQAAGLDTPTSTLMVRATLRGIKRQLGTAPSPKDALRTGDLVALVDSLPRTLLGTRDRSLLLLGFAGAFRRSELVALDIEDLTWFPEGLVVLVRRSKTDQEGEGRQVGVPVGSRPETCPVLAVRAWLDAAGIDTGPVFRPVDRHGNIGASRLTGQAVALVVKRAAQAAGIDPATVAGHSLRSGHATSAAEAGASERSIMRTAGHRSERTVRRYIRQATIWQDNSSAALGL